MMLRSVLLKTLRDQGRSLIGWLVGLTLLIAYTVSFWPSMEGSTALQQVIDDLPEALVAIIGGADMATARGFFSTQLFAFMLPVLIAVLGIGKAAGTLAGEEERGVLELLLGQPVSRARVALEKIVGILLTVALVTVVVGVVLASGIRMVEADVTLREVAGGIAGLTLLGWVFTAAAFATGAATGSRGAAVTAGAVLALVAYIMDAFSHIRPNVEWFQLVSPWYWAFRGDALALGPAPGGAAALLMLAALLVLAGVWRFAERDVGR